MKGQHDLQDYNIEEARISTHSRCTLALAGDITILYRIRPHDSERRIRLSPSLSVTVCLRLWSVGVGEVAGCVSCDVRVGV